MTLFPIHRLDLHKLYQLTVNGRTPIGLTGATGVPLDGLGIGTPGTNYVRKFSGKILAGPAPAMLSVNPKKFGNEQKDYVAEEKKLAAAEEKPAARQKRLAVVLPLLKGPLASAADALSALGRSTARPMRIRKSTSGISIPAVDLVPKDGPGNNHRQLQRSPYGGVPS